MTEPEKLVLEHLRHIRSDMSGLRDDMRDVKQRLTNLEIAVGNLAASEANHYAMTAVRADRVDERLERRINLADA